MWKRLCIQSIDCKLQTIIARSGAQIMHTHGAGNQHADCLANLREQSTEVHVQLALPPMELGPWLDEESERFPTPKKRRKIRQSQNFTRTLSSFTSQVLVKLNNFDLA
ncbi:unnamed protein product [Ilex paraguariensis]|uniref:RNase H type-1 domain-containing protein n=1 Tax=Ilex paraguariensis TaxID=185542 RepID=A0ABC8U9H5_9AQUA